MFSWASWTYSRDGLAMGSRMRTGKQKQNIWDESRQNKGQNIPLNAKIFMSKWIVQFFGPDSIRSVDPDSVKMTAGCPLLRADGSSWIRILPLFFIGLKTPRKSKFVKKFRLIIYYVHWIRLKIRYLLMPRYIILKKSESLESIILYTPRYLHVGWTGRIPLDLDNFTSTRRFPQPARYLGVFCTRRPPRIPG